MWTVCEWPPLIGFLSWLLHASLAGVPTRWESWWTYTGIAGPPFWGLHTLEYYMCHKGKHQSPVNIDPRRLVFDPNLDKLHITNQVGGWVMRNTGHDITLEPVSSPLMTISGGPLSYNYTVSEIKLHFGSVDTIGSEHTVNGTPFSAEIQFIAFNAELFENFTRARTEPNSIAILSVLVQIHHRGNKEFNVIINQLSTIPVKGNRTMLPSLNLKKLLPQTEFYMTYPGSFTQPRCEEVVTWVILNKPMYISKQQINALRRLTKIQDPGQILMENNFRPPLPLHQRTIRTNINIKDPKCAVRSTVEYTFSAKTKTHIEEGGG